MPILARAVLRRRLSSRGGERRLIPKRSAAVAGLRRKRERVNAVPIWSGCGELELAQGVEGAFADLAGDGQSRHGGVASLAGGAVEAGSRRWRSRRRPAGAGSGASWPSAA